MRCSVKATLDGRRDPGGSVVRRRNTNTAPQGPVLLVVPAAFRMFPGCCPDPIEPGDRAARLPGAAYVHERCAPRVRR